MTLRNIILGAASIFSACLSFGQGSLSNAAYCVSLKDGGAVELSSKQGGGTWVFKPDFIVLQGSKDPKINLRPAGVEPNIPYNILSWESDAVPASALLKKTAGSTDFVGDGFDDSILKAKTAGRTADAFYGAPNEAVKLKSAKLEDGAIKFAFEESENFSLSAILTVPDGSEAPVLAFEFTPKKNAYYSVAYVGAPAYKAAAVEGIWQPFIWQEKRFPAAPYMTAAFQCPIPATFVATGGATVAVVADPSEIPFMPLPKLENSRFGVVVRKPDGEFASMMFAPIYGGFESKMKKGENFNFKMRLFACKGGITDAFESAARDIYKMRDYRSNEICSLNETIDNMTDYALTQYAWFIDELKGCSYATDAPGSVKNVSALNPFEIALVKDDKAMFDKRAYPILEYMLSREKFLMALDRSIKTQSPSRKMNGPCTPVSEMAVFYGLSNGASSIFMEYAKELFPLYRVLNLQEVSGGGTWMDAMDIYINGGGQEYFERAKKGADEYIAKEIDSPRSSYTDRSFFWTSFAPRFADLFRLYEITGDKKYLEAARKSARTYAMYVWMCPQIPQGKVIVQPDGYAPWYGYLKSKGHPRMKADKEDVDAWRLSEIGLTPESSGTMGGHRGIFMANYASWFMRIGAASGDKFLCDIARSAIVGRYRNFPGYHINTDRTTIYEKADYPLRDHKEFSVNSFHYNHIMPMVSLLIDYLVSDIEVRAKGQIEFPARYIEGYSYLQSKFYGDRAGKFYGHENIWLWMPVKLLEISSAELNYISARGANGGLYAAFANQSRRAVGAKIVINKELVKFEDGKEYAVDFYKAGESKPFKTGVMKNGIFEVEVPAMGLTAAVIEGVKPEVRFQNTLQNLQPADAWKTDRIFLKTGNTVALIINFGSAHKTAFVYLKDDDDSCKSAALIYEKDGKKVHLEDASYPFEFTVPLDADSARFDFEIEVEKLDGSKATEKASLQK